MKPKRIIPLVLALALAIALFGFSSVAEGTGYADVSSDAWYAGAVAYCQEQGWMSGTSETAFSPDGTMTRSMLATVLYRQAGSSAVTGTDSFTDTEDNTWYSAAVVWAAQENIINGFGIASSQGKNWIHSGGRNLNNSWTNSPNAFLEAMAEAGKSVSDYLGNGDRIVYINVMNRLSVDCDCDGNPAEPDMHDIGILASTDPVALDQACVDLIYAQKDGDGASLVNRIESRNGLHTLEHAEDIGLGSRTYTLVSIDN